MPAPGRRLVVAMAALVVALVISWHIVTGVATGVGRLFGIASNVTNSQPTVQLRRIYVVSTGDTVAAIAARFGVSPSDLLAANHLRNPNIIFVGQRLMIPTPYHPALTRRLITSTAQHFHLDPAFAMGLADQESGFNENVISNTGAVGVMQVEPGTADLVAKDMGRSFDLGLEADNITVGVYWLAYLSRYYGGNERSAAAAYYEGMGNLANHGYLAGTQQYVDNVMALRARYAHP